MGVGAGGAEVLKLNDVKDLSDDELLARYVASQEREAAGVLFRRHADAAFRLALRMVGNAADAEDAVQSAFVAILKNAERFDPRGTGSVRAWMMGFVVNATRHRGREESRRMRRQRAAGELSGGRERLTTEKRERVEAVRVAMERLPEHYRTPLWLHYYEGLSAGEVAVAMDSRVDTVRKQILRGVEKLKGILAGAGMGALVPDLTALLGLLPRPEAPASLKASVEAFVDTGAFPGAAAAGAAPASAAGVSAGTKIFLGAATAVALAAGGAWALHKPDPASPVPGEQVIAPDATPVPAQATAGLVFKDEFDGTKLDPFWVREGAEQAIGLTSFAGQSVLRVDARRAGSEGAEVRSKPIALNGGPVEIVFTAPLQWVRKAGASELCMQVADGQGRVLLEVARRTVNNEAAYARAPRTSCHCYVSPEGRMATRMWGAPLQESGEMAGTVEAVVVRFGVRGKGGADMGVMLDAIEVRRLEAWPSP